MSKNTDIARVLLILRVEKRVCQKMKCANLGCAKKIGCAKILKLKIRSKM